MKKTLSHKLKMVLSSLLAVILLVSLFVAAPFASAASFNKQINYQGKLTDRDGAAVPNGNYNLEFILYDGAGTAVWTETRTGGDRVAVTGGLFSVMLGAVTPITSVDFNQTLYLGVNVGGLGLTPTWDGEMTPRKILGTVPSAFEADKLDGLDSSAFFKTTEAITLALSSASSLLSVTQSGAGTIADFRNAGGSVFAVSSDGVSTLAQMVVSGTANIQGALSVTAAATSSFSSHLSVGKNLTVEGNGIFSGNVSAANMIATGTLAVNGLSTLTNASTTNLTVSGTATLGSWSGVLIGTSGQVSALATSSLNINTDNLVQGSTNLFWSNALFDTRLAATTSLPNLATLAGLSTIGSSTGQTTVLGKTVLTNASTTNLTVSGTAYVGSLTGMLYGSNGMLSAIATSSLNINTDNLVQGSTNLFWSNALFDTRLAATTSLPNLATLAGLSTIGSSTGQTTVLGKTVLTNASTTNLTVSGFLTNDEIQANTAARHNALTLGLASGLSLNGQQLSLSFADATHDGALASTSYAAFAAKQNAITAGNVLQYLRGDLSLATLDTSAVPENGNLYWTDARFDSRLAGTTTLASLATIGSSTGQTRVMGSLGVGGTTSDTYTLQVDGSGYFSGHLESGNLSATGTLSVVGHAYFGNASTSLFTATELTATTKVITPELAAEGITLGGIYRTTWPSSTSGGGGGSWWATTTDNLVGFPDLPGQYTIVVGAAATTTTGVRFEVVGHSKMTGNLTVTGQTNFANSSTTNLSLSGFLNVTEKATFAHASATELTVANKLTVNGKSSLTNASTTNLTVSTAAYLGALSSSFLAVNQAGQIIATTTPLLSYTETEALYAAASGTILRFGTSTDALTEGNNLFWTNTRFDTRLAATTSLPSLATLAGLSTIGSSTGQTTVLGKTVLTNASTTNLTVTGTAYVGSLTGMLYGSNGMLSAIATSSLNINTDNLVQGSTNLFWSNALFDTRLAATTSLPSLATLAGLSTIGSSTGQTTVLGKTVLTNASTTNLTVSGTATLGSWSGVLIGTSGQVSALATSSLNINTDNLVQGNTNLFWSNALFDTRLAATTSLPNLATLAGLSTIGSSTGQTTVLGKTVLTNASTTNLTVSTAAYLGSLSSTYLAVNQNGQIIATSTPILGLAWGAITGTLTDQTDLNNALALKVNISTTSMASLSTLSGLSTIGSSTGQTNVAGRLGISSSTPQASLALSGTAGVTPFTVASSTGNAMFTITQAGNVGIGIINPGSKLSVQGDFNLAGLGSVGSTTLAETAASVIAVTGSSTGVSGALTLTNRAASAATGGVEIRFRASSAFTNDYYSNRIASVLNAGQTAADLVFYNWKDVGHGGEENFRISGLSGNVGVGSSTPLSTLSVSGVTGTNPFTIASSTGNALFSVTQAGNAGINTGSPRMPLDIVQTNNDILNGIRTTMALTEASGYPTIQLVGGTNQKMAMRGSNDGGLHFFLRNSAGNFAASDEKLTLLPSGNVGVGSTTPLSSFSVSGAAGTNPFTIASSTGNALLTVTQAGQLGVGSSTPAQLLSVQGGNLLINRTGNLNGNILIGDGPASDYPGIWFGGNASSPNYTNYSFLWESTLGILFNAPSGKNVIFRVNNGEVARMNSAGNFGLGTSTLSNRLEVSGNTYLGGNLTATGTLEVFGKSTLGNASTTNLTVSTAAYLGALSSSFLAVNQAGQIIATTTPLLSYTETEALYAAASGTILRFGTSTDALTEGNNLFWTNTRFDTRLAATTSLPNLATLAGLSTIGSSTGQTTVLGKTVLTNASTTNLTVSGTAYVGSLTGMLYGVNGMLTAMATSSINTDHLTQGSTNLFWSNALFDTRLAATTSLPNLATLAGLSTVGSSTGQTAILGKTVLTNASTTNLTVSGWGYVAGNLGVGTLAPTRTLDIAANVTHSANGLTSQLTVRGTGDATQKLNIGYDTTSNYGFLEAIDESVAWQNLALQPSGGRVGIGTTTPSDVLTVNGNIGLPAAGIIYSENAGSISLANRGNQWAASFSGDGNNTVIDTPYNDWNLRWSRAGNSAYQNMYFQGSNSIGTHNYVSIIGSTFNVGINTVAPAAMLSVRGTTTQNLLSVLTTAGTNVFHIDSNGLVGVGSSTPLSSLSVSGKAGTNPFTIASSTGNAMLSVDQAGNVGLGTVAQAGRLEIWGTATGLNGNTAATTLRIVDTSSATTGTGGEIVFSGYYNGTSQYAYNLAGIKASKTNSVAGDYSFGLDFYTRQNGSALARHMTLTNLGNLGLGTTSPSNKLEVNGAGYFTGNLWGANLRATGTLDVAGSSTLTDASTTNLSVSGTLFPAHTVQFPNFSIFDGKAASSTADYQFLAVMNASSSYPSTLYIIPSGNPTLTRGKFEIFNTNYAADQYNYNSLTLRTRNDPTYGEAIYISSNHYGTPNLLPIIFTMDTLGSPDRKVLTMNTDGTVINHATTTIATRLNVGTTTYNAVPGSQLVVDGGTLTVMGTTGTSTFSGGINLSSGCFAVNGVCVETPTSGWVDSVTNVLFNNTDMVSIGTSSPLARLYVGGTYTGSGSTLSSSGVAGDGYIPDGGSIVNVTARVYPYKLWNGNRIYSINYSTGSYSFECPPGDPCAGFDIEWDWSDASEADGYRLYLNRDGNAYSYVDVVASSYLDQGTGGIVGDFPDEYSNNTGMVVEGGVVIGYGVRESGVPTNGLLVEGVTTLNNELWVQGKTFFTDVLGQVATSTVTVDGSLCVFSDPTYCGNTPGVIYADNQSIQHADLAEDYPTLDESLEAGDLVALTTETASAATGTEKVAYVAKADSTNKDRLFGIVSTEPGVRFGFGLMGNQKTQPVALAGRVPLKVSLENGAIKVGDRITLSSLPGVGMKASESGMIVGIALENYSGEDGEDIFLPVAGTSTEAREVKMAQINVLVTLRYAELAPVIDNGEITLREQAIWTIAAGTGEIKPVAGLNLDNLDITNVRALRSASGNWSLSAEGLLTVKEIQTEKLCLGQTCITEAELRALLQTASINSVIAPTVPAGPAPSSTVSSSTSASSTDTAEQASSSTPAAAPSASAGNTAETPAETLADPPSEPQTNPPAESVIPAETAAPAEPASGQAPSAEPARPASEPAVN